MKAAIISLGSVSSQMTAEAMRKYFDSVDMIQLRDIEVNFGKEGGIIYRGQELGYYDCVLVKGSFRYSYLLRSIATFLEKKVPYMPFPGDSFTLAHNKLLTHLVLQQYNIPMPRTYMSPSIESAKELLKKVTYPIVMKFPEGTQGKGVMFADSLSSAASLLDALGALNQPFIIQEYVETGGTDIRALVVGDKVVASMKRKAQREEKRANIHAGGTGEPVLLTMETVRIAVNTAKAIGAEICGVDILESPFGPQVIEVNISPGLQGINQVCTIDVPDAIARYLYQKTLDVVQRNRSASAAEIMDEISLSHKEIASQKIISALTFRGQRIILPEFVTNLAGFSDDREYSIVTKKGRIEIEKL